MKLPTEGKMRKFPVLVAGVVLAGVPTLYTVFPDMTERSHKVRVLIVLGWVCVLGATVLGSMRRDGKLDKITTEVAAAQSQLRRDAFFDIVTALCTKPGCTAGYLGGAGWGVSVVNEALSAVGAVVGPR